MVLAVYSSATFSVVQNTWIEPPSSAGGPFQTASFYLDSSGRSKVDLPLLLKFPSQQALQLFLDANCVQPTHSAGTPKGIDKPTKPDDPSTDPTESRFSFGIEAKVSMTSGSGEAVSATVESVAISSSRVDSNGEVLHLETQTVLRVSRLEDEIQGKRLESSSLNGVRVLLEITAVLSEKSDLEDRAAAASNGLRAVYLGRYADLGKTSARRVVYHRLNPIALQVKLSHAFSIAARSIRGTIGGETLVSLGISHSNTHEQEVLVSNLALHPAFSRSLKSGAQSDQSAAVQWSFVPGSQLQLPLKIRPNEAYATILHVLGSSETGQAFLSPLSATAAVNLGQSTLTNAIAAVDVEWVSASQVPTDASDALRITVTVDQQNCKVGDPFAVKLTVHNLGQATASNLKVGHRTADYKDFQVFWTPPNSSTDLLEIDDALPLGEIRTRESTEAVLRLIPLDAGTLPLPQFEICDGNKTYRCAHNVQIVATV